MHADASGRTAAVHAPSDAKPPAVLPPVPILPPPSLFLPPNLYLVQPGDTLVRIAKHYLGNANRWKDVWALNPVLFANRSADVLYPGELLAMPAEAIPPWAFPPSGEPPGPAPDWVCPAPERWLSAAIDGLHDALFAADFDLVWSVLEQVPVAPRDEAVPELTSWDAQLAARVAMVELALEGRIGDFYLVEPPGPMDDPGGEP